MKTLTKVNQSKQLAELLTENNHNNLWEYIENLSPEVCSNLYHPSKEVLDIITNNVNQILPSSVDEESNRSIDIDVKNLKHLLMSVMKTGYFLKSIENQFEEDSV